MDRGTWLDLWSRGKGIAVSCALGNRRDEASSNRRRRRLGAGVPGGAVSLVAALILAGSARGDEPVESSLDRWEPRFDLALGVHNQTIKTRGTNTLGGEGKAERAILTAFIGPNGSIATPALTTRYGRPRIYVRAGYRFPTAAEPTILDDQIPIRESELTNDPTLCGTPTPGTIQCEHAIRTDLQIQDLWHVGLGIEIDLPIQFQHFKLDLGIEYLGERFQYSGTSFRTDRGRVVPRGPIEILDTISLPQVTETDFVHTLGPRAALLVEAGKVGPLIAYFSIETAFSFYLSEFDTRFGQTSGVGSQSFRVQSKQPFITQASGVLRLVWP